MSIENAERGREQLEPATGDYETDRQRHARAFVQGLPAALGRVEASLSEVHRIRDERLGGLLRHAQSESPWHAKRLASLDVDRITGDDLTAIPPMTKSDLMENWDDIVCDRRLNLTRANAHLEQIAEQGPAYRAVVVWDFDGMLQTHLRMVSASWWANARLGIEQVYPLVIATVTSTSPVHMGGAFARCFHNRELQQMHAIAASAPIEQVVERLEALQPFSITAYPSILHELARRRLRGKLDIAPATLASAGEPLLPEARTCIVEAFSAPIHQVWGASEMGAGALALAGGGEELFLCEDVTIVEPVDESGRAVDAGQPAAKVLVTNLTNRVLPVIRYEITDAVTWLPPDPEAPWPTRRLASVQGRLDDVFHYGDRPIHPHTFRSVLARHASVPEYQVHQTEHGAAVLIPGANDVPREELARDLEAALRQAGLTRPQVRVEVVDGIERHAQSAKLKRFVPLSSDDNRFRGGA
jgi:phenylacetate-coenzyme A ligase PaaK-like adenylate-forming protein